MILNFEQAIIQVLMKQYNHKQTLSPVLNHDDRHLPIIMVYLPCGSLLRDVGTYNIMWGLASHICRVSRYCCVTEGANV